MNLLQTIWYGVACTAGVCVLALMPIFLVTFLKDALDDWKDR